jgi:hypothetical protein
VLADPATWRPYPWDRVKDTGTASNFANYKNEYGLSAKVLLSYLPDNPNSTQMHFEIADALYRAEQDKAEADLHARRALHLDEVASQVLLGDPDSPMRARRLTDRQRSYLRSRLGSDPSS